MDLNMKLSFLLCFVVLSSCGEGVSGIEFNDFLNRVISTAGDGAVDCGQVEVGSSQLEANMCVVDSFTNKSPFRAIYLVQGIDSSVATAIAAGEDNKVYYLYFDSDPSGGARLNNGRISQIECLDAEYQGSVDVDCSELFSCAN